MKKTKLIIDYEYDFELLGIISSAKYYKLAWSINKKLKVNLCKQQDIILSFRNNKNIIIDNYIFESEPCIFRLLKNRSVGEQLDAKSFLIPEMPYLDYVVMNTMPLNGMSQDELATALKQIDSIEMVQKIDVEKLKSRDNFLF